MDDHINGILILWLINQLVLHVLLKQKERLVEQIQMKKLPDVDGSSGGKMLRSNRRVQRHSELLELLIMYPTEGKEAVETLGIGHLTPPELTQKQEKTIIKTIKERLNGSDHS